MSEDPVALANIIEVAAGLVFHEGKLLITQRPSTGHLANLWEFPGGKREPGESFEECLHRELKEELGIEVAGPKLFESVRHTYPEKTVHLLFYTCRLKSGVPQTIGCQDFRWVTRTEIAAFEFPAADEQLIIELESSDRAWNLA